MQNFVKICQTVSEISRFFDFQDGCHLPSWILKFSNFWFPISWRGLRCIIIPNFIKIGRQLQRYCVQRFSKWRPSAILDFLTRGSAIAEGLRDVLVSRNSATTKHPIWKLESRPIVWHYLRDPTFSRFRTIPEYDRHTQTDRRTDARQRHVPCLA